MQDDTQLDLVALSADLVVEYVSHNSLSAHGLPGLIVQVHNAFARLSRGTPTQVDEQPITKPTPAQIRRSITPDALISFIDGKPYQTLKRHLRASGLEFRVYRERFGLPADYPTVAPNYSARRSALAKSFRLGNHGYLADRATAAEAVPKTAPVKLQRTARPRKAAEPA